MKVKMRKNRIAVESLNKIRKSTDSLLTMPDTADCTGVVRYVSEDVTDLKVGSIVCYGSDRQRVKLEGKDLEIMDPDNVFATLVEESSGGQEEKTEV